MNKNKRWSEAERTLILELYWQLSHEEMDKLKDEHPKIIALAEMLGTEDKATSIYLRLLNFTSLDPNAAAALPHVGKKDKELWEKFYNQWDKLAAACQKARETLRIPLAEESVPDEADYTAETRQVMIAQRMRQHDFRERILANYHNRCCISDISEPRLLVASHIKPWSQDKENRLNPANGLCLSPLYDKAFDNGLISLDGQMRVILSDTVKNNESLLPFFAKYEGQPIAMPFRYKPDPEFVAYHRDHIFNHG